MRKVSLILAIVAAMSLGALSAVPASADCGWPNCNPANMSGADYSTGYPPNGSPDTIYTAFSSSIAYPFFETWVSFSGTSDDGWWGCCPWNPDSNTLSDNWGANGIAVNVVISWPPGVGFSGSGGSAGYSTNSGANWLNHHNYSNIQFQAADIWSVTQNACSSMQFSWDSEYHCTWTHSVNV